MRIQSLLSAAIAPAAILLMASPLLASPDEDESYQGEAADRYAQVRFVEGDIRVRKGDYDETLSRGVPIGEGDLLEGKGRGILQLGDGTRLAFDRDCRLEIAALFKDSQGERQVLLRLDRGALKVNLGGREDCRFRVDTPSGTVSFFDRGSLVLEVEADRSLRVRVSSGKVKVRNERGETTLGAGDALTVYSPNDALDRVRSISTYSNDGFSWADASMERRRSRSYDYVPSDIRPYSDDLDEYGEWIETEEYGRVWRPTRVDSEWRPYYQGRWAPYSYGMTWIPDEPWGYVVYHHGRWGWSSRWGWHWIPGRHWAPAWVAWSWTGDYCAWAPLGYYNHVVSWHWGPYNNWPCWNVINLGFLNVRHIHRHIHRESHIIRHFGGSGAVVSNLGDRPRLVRSPLILTSNEFRNPTHITRALDRSTLHQRLTTYERTIQTQTGRTIVRRNPAELRDIQNRDGVGRGQVPFENRRNLDENRRPADRTPDRSRERTPDRNPIDRTPERTPDPTRTQPDRTDRIPVDRDRFPSDRRNEDRREDRPIERRHEERRPERTPVERRPEERPSGRDTGGRTTEPTRPVERRDPTPAPDRRERTPDRTPERSPERSTPPPSRSPERSAPPAKSEEPSRSAPPRRNASYDFQGFASRSLERTDWNREERSMPRSRREEPKSHEPRRDEFSHFQGRTRTFRSEAPVLSRTERYVSEPRRESSRSHSTAEFRSSSRSSDASSGSRGSGSRSGGGHRNR